MIENIMYVDCWINMQMKSMQIPLLSESMITLTNLNNGMGILVFSIAFMLFFAYKKWYHALLFYFVSILGAQIAFVSIKLIIQRIRPVSDIIFASGYSFPSGHATMATALSLTLYVIFAKRVSGLGLRLPLLFISVFWIVLISFSRIYLGVHWFSDVIAGVVLGFSWVTFLVFVFYDKLKR